MNFDTAIHHLKNHQYEKSIQIFNNLIRENSEFIEAIYYRSIAKLKMDDLEGSLADLDLALEISPTDPDLISQKGVLYFHLKKYQLALEQMNKAANFDPNNAYRYSSRAYIRDKMKDTKGAVEDYRKAIELDPDDAIAYNNLGMLEEKLGYIEKAKENLRKADQLAQEQGLDEILYPSNSKEKAEETILPKPEIQNPKPVKNTYFTIIKEVFTSKERFKEFVDFIRKK